jgi:hypothetical protein
VGTYQIAVDPPINIRYTYLDTSLRLLGEEERGAGKADIVATTMINDDSLFLPLSTLHD